MYRLWVSMTILLSLTLIACGDHPESPPEMAPLPSEKTATEVTPEEAVPEETQFSNYSELGDLKSLQDLGWLRILSHRNDDSYLPRLGDPLYQDEELLSRFAHLQGLQTAIIPVEDFSQLIPELLAGHGDVIAANLTITEQRQQLMSFSLPVAHSTELLVGRSNEEHNHADKLELNKHTISVQPDTSFWSSVKELQSQYPGLQISSLSTQLTSDEILDQIATGAIDLSVEDSVVFDIVKRYRDDVSAIMPVSVKRPLLSLIMSPLNFWPINMSN